MSEHAQVVPGQAAIAADGGATEGRPEGAAAP